jgi:uracil phosphoribosyltransferase
MPQVFSPEINMKIITLILSLIVYTNLFAATTLGQLVYEIRDPKTGPAHFRQALEKIGEYLALEVADACTTKEAAIQTVNGVEAKHHLINETPVVVTILRAGLPLVSGIHKVFPGAPVGFIAMSRNEETLKAKIDYIALPEMEGRTVILADTMLATGGSIIDALRIIEPYQPKKVFIITAIAAVPGIERIAQYDPNIKIFAAAVDPALNEAGYIIPGLGDAGDRLYGKKHLIER